MKVKTKPVKLAKRNRKYRCRACQATMMRVSTNKTMRSFCEKTGKTTRLILASL